MYTTRCFTILKHDRYTQELLEQISLDYHHIEQNRSIYSAKKRMIAEVDIIGHHKDGIDVFEVKCGYRITKARKQLYKIKRLLQRTYNKTVNMYFYHGGSSELIRIY